EAMTMGDRICVMKDGVIQQVDTPLNIYDRPANTFVAGFIGTPPMNIFKGRIEAKDQKFFFKNPNMEIVLPEAWSEVAKKYQDKDILFGIRPENIGHKQVIVAPESIQYIKAKVEVIEPMGAETYLYLDAETSNKCSCIARVEAHTNAKVGEALSLPLLFDNAHLFDPESTNVLV
ncbi:MAG: ABC transporter ATP-binding protein, partial [Lentisphaeria bacterium]|nr:ABC transporter ATP-binding protein [Lentisphaeria bacterium]